MTRNDDLRAVAMACFGGADIGLIEKRTRNLGGRERQSAFRALVAAGTLRRDGSTFRVRDHVDRYCIRCAQKLRDEERGAFRGMTTICTTCEGNKR